jgi:hypothetical protein
LVGPFPCDGAEEELSGVVDVVGHGELVAGPRPAALLVDQNLKTGPVRRVCARPVHRRAKAAVCLRRSWLLPSWLLSSWPFVAPPLSAVAAEEVMR